MDFKTISIILSLLSFDFLMVFSSPVQEYSTNVVDISKNEIEVVPKSLYLENKAEEVTDISSDEDKDLNDIFNKVSEINNFSEEAVEDITEIDSADEEENVCNSKECLEVSNLILKYMDASIDPCDDFYQFTCGNYKNYNPVDEETPHKMHATSASDKNEDNIINIIQGDYKPNKNLSKQDQEYDEIVFNKLKTFYNSCADVDSLNERGVKPLFDLINQLEINENKNKYNDPDVLARTLFKIHNIKKFGLSDVLNAPLFIMEPTMDPTTGTIFIALRESISIINKDKISQIKDVLLNIYKDSDEKDIDKMIDSVLEFEKKLLKKEEAATNGLLTVKTLNEQYPIINWKLYLEEKFGSADMMDFLDDNTIVLNLGVNLEKLGNILSEVDGETLSNYFEMFIILNYIDFLPDNIKKPLVRVYPRKKICYNTIGDAMKSAISRYFVENYYSPAKGEFTEKVLEYIKQSLINRISKVEWLDEETREYAYKKIASMKETIGYDEKDIKPDVIYEKYQSLEFDDNFFNNMVNYYEYLNNDLVKVIKSSKTEISIFLPAHYINAVNVYSLNQINIPAGIMQPPMFSSGIPDYINYSGLGFIIGHELTHSFDNIGKDYDMNGNSFNWWTDNDLNEYEDLTKCFINQYNKFYIEDDEGEKHNIDGKETLSENLADNSGLARAYESWKNSLMEDPETVKKENPQLPGLTQYTADQLFFISYGHSLCENYIKSKDYVNKLISEDNHSPGFARINGALSNSKYFAQAFNCPLKSKMNPEKKCELW